MKSNFKRWLSIVLTMAMLQALLTVPAMASTVNKGTMLANALPVTETLFNEDFNRADATVTTSTKVDTAITNSSVVSARGASISGNKLVTANPGSGQYSSFLVQQGMGLAKCSGTYVVDFDFMQPTAGRIDTLFAHYQLDATGATYQFPSSKIAASSADATKFVVYAGSVETTFSPVNGQWHNMKAVINFDELTYDVYIDGTLFAYGVSFAGGTVTLDSNVTTVTMRPFYSGYAFAETHYDNIKIYRTPTDRKLITVDSVEGYTNDITFTQDNKKLVRLAGLPIITSSANQPKNFTVDSTNDRFSVAAGAAVMAVPTISSKKLVFQATVTLPEKTNYGVLYFTTHSGAAHAATQVYATKDDICVQESGSSGVVIVGNYEANTPYTITLYMDLDKTFTRELNVDVDTVDGTADGYMTAYGMFDVYVNQVCVATNVKMHYNATNNAVLDNFGRLICISAPQAPFYLEDIMIYEDTREAVLSAAAAAFDAAYPDGAVYTDTFTLPASSNSNYTLTWSTDASAFNISGTTGTVSLKGGTGLLTATVTDVNNQYSISRSFEVKHEAFTLTESDVYVPKTYAGAKLIVASYAGEQLIDIAPIDVTADGIDKTIAETELDTSGADKIKAFLWNNLEDILPLAGDEEVELATN